MPYISTGWLFWEPKRRSTEHYATVYKVSIVISSVWLADYFSLSLLSMLLKTVCCSVWPQCHLSSSLIIIRR